MMGTCRGAVWPHLGLEGHCCCVMTASSVLHGCGYSWQSSRAGGPQCHIVEEGVIALTALAACCLAGRQAKSVCSPLFSCPGPSSSGE